MISMRRDLPPKPLAVLWSFILSFSGREKVNPPSLTEYSRPLTNTGLSCAGPLTYTLQPYCIIHVWIQNPWQGGPAVKVHSDFSSHRGAVPRTLVHHSRVTCTHSRQLLHMWCGTYRYRLPGKKPVARSSTPRSASGSPPWLQTSGLWSSSASIKSNKLVLVSPPPLCLSLNGLTLSPLLPV